MLPLLRHILHALCMLLHVDKRILASIPLHLGQIPVPTYSCYFTVVLRTLLGIGSMGTYEFYMNYAYSILSYFPSQV
jgi:hypothetical protein